MAQAPTISQPSVTALPFLKPVIEQIAIAASQISLTFPSPSSSSSAFNSGNTSFSSSASSSSLAALPFLQGNLVLEIIHCREIQLNGTETDKGQAIAKPTYCYKLELSDGVHKIPAVLHTNLHDRAANGEFREGCLVRLGKFEVRKAVKKSRKDRDKEKFGGDHTVDQVLVPYLGVHELEVIGEPFRSPFEPSLELGYTVDEQEARRKSNNGKYGAECFGVGPPLPEFPGKPLQPPALVKAANNTAQIQSHTITTASNPSVLGKRLLPPSSVTISKLETHVPPTKRPHFMLSSTHQGNTDSSKPFELSSNSRLNTSTGSQSSVTSITPSLLSPSLPFTVENPKSLLVDDFSPVPLASLKIYQQGQKVDVLAVVKKVSSELIFRPRIGTKRDIQLIDSTKYLAPTILSVWVEPEKFVPKVGTIIAFRNLTVHNYNGKHLNAYVGDCAGRCWYHEEPEPAGQFEGVGKLRNWLENMIAKGRMVDFRMDSSNA